MRIIWVEVVVKAVLKWAWYASYSLFTRPMRSCRFRNALDQHLRTSRCIPTGTCTGYLAAQIQVALY